MMSSELRATVSSGLTRPPTSTGNFPNFTRSTSSFATLGGIQFPPIQPAITIRTIHGTKRFIPPLRSVFWQSRPNEFQIEQAIPRQRSRTRRREQRNSDCARLEEL